MSAVGQDAEDPLGLRLVPYLVHADAAHNVLTVLFPLQPWEGSENISTHMRTATPSTAGGPQSPPPASLGVPEV